MLPSVRLQLQPPVTLTLTQTSSGLDVDQNPYPFADGVQGRTTGWIHGSTAIATEGRAGGRRKAGDCHDDPMRATTGLLTAVELSRHRWPHA